MLEEPLVYVGEGANYKTKKYELNLDDIKKVLQVEPNELYGDVNYGKRSGRQMILGKNQEYKGEVTYKDGKLDGPILLVGSDSSLRAEGEYQNGDVIFVRQIKPDVTRSWEKESADGYHCEESFFDGKLRVRFNVDERGVANGPGVVIEEGAKRAVSFKEGQLKEKGISWHWIAVGVASILAIIGGLVYWLRKH